jgi:hypothetical protein
VVDKLKMTGHVDNLKLAGEKRCRKKNFFGYSFALYFAHQTAGHIPIIKR